MIEPEEVHEKYEPLLAIAKDRSRRWELMDSEMLSLAAKLKNRHPKTYTQMVLSLSAWDAIGAFKSEVTRRSASSKRSREEDEKHKEAMLRLAKADEEGRPAIPEGNNVAIARDFITQVHPNLIVTGDTFLTYHLNHYREREKATIRSDLQKWMDNAVNADTGKPAFVSRKILDDVMDAIRNFAHLPMDEVKPPSWLPPKKGDPAWAPREEPDPEAGMVLACKNGLLDVTTEKVYANTPRFYTRNGLPYDYEDPCFVLPPYRWLKFLEEVWPDAKGGRANKESLQEWLGHLLTNTDKYQKILLLMGESRAGKGVILKVLDALIGPANIANMLFSSLKNPHGSSALLGKSVMVVPDLRLTKDDSSVIEFLLALTGGDSVPINRKFRDFISARLGTRVVLATNIVLTVPDQSGAFANRLHPLVFTRKFEEWEQDPLLASKIIRDELPGILHWALQGLRRLEDRGRFEMPPQSAKVIQGIRHQAGPVSTFVKEWCVLEEDAVVRKRDLWRAFERYCADLDIPNRYVPESFGRDLVKNATGFFRVATDRVTVEGGQASVYTGIRLTEKAAKALAEAEDDY